MEKTKLGISVGLMGAAVYFLGLIGMTPAILLAGYILIRESDEWLRKTAVKGIAVVVAFAVVGAGISLISGSYDLISDFLDIFRINFSFPFFSSIMSFIRTAIRLIELLVLLICGLSSLRRGNVRIPMIDPTVDKNM